MSVYTRVERAQAQAFAHAYGVGTLLELRGIADGIENTNYFLTTDQGRYVLTLFERHAPQDLAYFMGLMQLLAERGVPCARPLPGLDGAYLRPLEGRPAALVERLPGAALKDPWPVHCGAVGDALGQIHRAGFGYGAARVNERGPTWWESTALALRGKVDEVTNRLLAGEIAYQMALDVAALPRGVIHADLFRDNALFEGEHLCGVIDYYAACNDILLYDVAICVNDWCVTADGALDPLRGRAFLAAYHAQRPLTDAEHLAWPAMLRAAALRFWLSRLYDLHFPRGGELTHLKDPEHFGRIVRARGAADAAAAAWGLWPAPAAGLAMARG